MRHLVVPALVLIVAASCGGSGITPVDGGATLSPSEFSANLATAQCDYLVRCGKIGVAKLRQCVDGSTLANEAMLGIADGVASKRLRFDPAAARSCGDSLAATACHLFSAAYSACVASALTPLIALAGGCRSTLDCVGGWCERAQVNGCLGVCRALVAAGGACGSNREACDSSSACRNGQCVALASSGGACNVVQGPDCVAGLACAAGICLAPAAVGASCTDSPCVAGAFCQGTCKPVLPAGAACLLPDSCADGFGCDGAHAGGVSGKCTAWLDHDAACDGTAFSTACPRADSCDPKTNKCHTLPALGEDCSRSGVCDGAAWAYCDAATKVCKAKAPLGGACSPGSMAQPCLEGTCDSATMVCGLKC